MDFVYLDIDIIVRCNHWFECPESNSCDHGAIHKISNKEDCGNDCTRWNRPVELGGCFCIKWEERKDWDE